MATKKVQVFKVGSNELVLEFNSVKECAAYFNLDSNYISNNLSGKYKTIKNKQYYCKAVEEIYHSDNIAILTNRIPRAIDVYGDGYYISTYDSVKLAANATGVKPSVIYQWCIGRRKKPVRGYTFRYNLKRQQKNRLIPVDLYDVETDELYMSFNDIKECADFLGLSPQNIRANLRGEIKTVKARSFYCKRRKI